MPKVFFLHPNHFRVKTSLWKEKFARKALFILYSHVIIRLMIVLEGYSYFARMFY